MIRFVLAVICCAGMRDPAKPGRRYRTKPAVCDANGYRFNIVPEDIAEILYGVAA